MTGTPPVLSVAGLGVAMGPQAHARHVVNGVSFDIPPGGRLAIVGESGSGKSMTALAVIGLLPRGVRIAAGQISLGGREVDPSGPEMARIRGREIGMIFQDPMSALNPVMTVGDQLLEAIQAHAPLPGRAARARAIELLAAVQIPRPAERFDSWPHEFSGGMRQRVMIAMALAHRPRLLIADEPTTALDVTTQLQILRLIDSICRKEGAALLLITHDLGIVQGFCDRALVLYGGRMMEYGPVAEVLKRPLHPYTNGLITAIPPLDRDVELLESIPGEPAQARSADTTGCPFAPRCARADGSCKARTPVWRSLGGNVSAACHHLVPGSPAQVETL